MGAKPVGKTEKSSALPRSPELMNREDSALFVIDVQEKFLNVIPDRARIVWNIRRLLDAAAALGVPVAGAEQNPGRLGTTAAELKERIGPMPAKLCFSAGVCGEVFERWKNEGLYRVLLCGIETHVCVLQTALDLAAAGFEPYVAVDAVGTRGDRSRHGTAADGVGRRNPHDDRNGHVRMVPHGGDAGVQDD